MGQYDTGMMGPAVFFSDFDTVIDQPVVGDSRVLQIDVAS